MTGAEPAFADPSTGYEEPSPCVSLVAVGDPRSPTTWSGVTAGVHAGLVELGVRVQPVDLSLPGVLENGLLLLGAASTRNRFDAAAAALTRRVHTLRARTALTGGLGGVIQVGTSFGLPAGSDYVTLEDMTLRQAVAVHPAFTGMSACVVARWERDRREIYERARMCAVASHWAGDSLCADYGVPEEKVAVVGFGANHVVAGRERDWTVPRYLFVGIEWERKGGPILVRAFRRLRERVPQAELHVVGGHPPLDEPGILTYGVLSQARAPDRVRLGELFALATCLVMPSAVEPFGIVYVEAGAAGIPSIGSSVGGPADILAQGAGLTVEPGDEDGLLAAMLKLADPSCARSTGERARARSALYTWRQVAERLLRTLGKPAPDGRTLAAYL